MITTQATGGELNDGVSRGWIGVTVGGKRKRTHKGKIFGIFESWKGVLGKRQRGRGFCNWVQGRLRLIEVSEIKRLRVEIQSSRNLR
jgi:hypothetical protein